MALVITVAELSPPLYSDGFAEQSVSGVNSYSIIVIVEEIQPQAGLDILPVRFPYGFS